MRRSEQRIVGGLYFHPFGNRVTDHLNVDVVVLADISSRTARQKAEIEPIQRRLAAEPLHNLGPEVFKYRFRQEDDGRSIWLMAVNDAVEILGVIQPKRTIPTVAISDY